MDDEEAAVYLPLYQSWMVDEPPMRARDSCHWVEKMKAN
jgi:hypothetical protein